MAQNKAQHHDKISLDSPRAYRRLLQLAIQKTEIVNVDKQNAHASMANKIPKTEFKSESQAIRRSKRNFNAVATQRAESVLHPAVKDACNANLRSGKGP